MSTMEINCPHCGEGFELTEALAAPLLEAERAKIDNEVKRRLQAEVTSAEAKGRAAAEAEAAVKVRAAEGMAAESASKLREAQAQELEVRQERERLVQDKAAIELTVQRRVDEEKHQAATQARAAADGEWQARLAAADKSIADKDLKLRDAEQAEIRARQVQQQAEEALRQADIIVARRVEGEKQRITTEARVAVDLDWQAKMQAAQEALSAKDAKLRDAEQAEIRARQVQQQAEEALRQADIIVARRVDEEKQRITSEARAAVDLDWQAKMQAAQEALSAKDAKLRDAEVAELQARQLKLQADEALRQVELTVVRRLDEERLKVRETAMHERDEEHRLKVGEKDKQLDDMRKQIEELRRKGDRVAQQLAGDVLEIDLQDVLARAFPNDIFERVKKGQSGADLLQTVRTTSGQPCGRILWESKRTKTWNDGWLGKLREDQRGVKSDLAALVSETLPDSVQSFDAIDGVWVSAISVTVPMAAALRHGLIETARARVAADGAGTKKDLVYTYLTGAEFKQRVRGMVEPIVEMRESLMKEKVLLTRQWSTREKQLERAMTNMAHLYGDLHGIVGNSLPAVEGLSFPALDCPSEPVNTVAASAEQPQLIAADEIA